MAGRIKKLEKASRAEQADVDRLERGSLAAFFYQMIGRREEQLDKEREEACAARVRYDAAARELASIDADLERRRARLAQLEGCEGRYREALAEKVRELKAGHGPAAQELMECETRMEGMRLQKQELKEAIDAGRVALYTAGQVLDSLDSAEGWGTWDVMGGGLGVDLAKYGSLDEAQEQGGTAAGGVAAVQDRAGGCGDQRRAAGDGGRLYALCRFLFRQSVHRLGGAGPHRPCQGPGAGHPQTDRAGAGQAETDERRPRRPAGGRAGAAGTDRHRRRIKTGKGESQRPEKGESQRPEKGESHGENHGALPFFAEKWKACLT